MTEFNSGTSIDLVYVKRLRRLAHCYARDSSWFALIIFGVISLIATLFYNGPLGRGVSEGCRSAGSSVACLSASMSKGPFGSGLGTPLPSAVSNVSPWATTYWVGGIFAGICAVVLFNWIRSQVHGVAGKIWTFVIVGIGGLALAITSRGWIMIRLPVEFWQRGMQAFFVIGAGLIALAIVDRTWTLMVFVLGFVGLSMVSVLYNVGNLFDRAKFLGRWNGSDQSLPNIILPGTYLLIGGFIFWGVRARRLHRPKRIDS